MNSIDIYENNEMIHIRINANGFLYNTMRIMCGTLYEIGTGKLYEDVISEVFETGIREKAGITLPPCGLKLIEVFYQ